MINFSLSLQKSQISPSVSVYHYKLGQILVGSTRLLFGTKNINRFIGVYDLLIALLAHFLLVFSEI